MQRKHTHLYVANTEQGNHFIVGSEPTVREILDLFKLKEVLENSKEKNGATCHSIFVELNQGMTKYKLKVPKEPMPYYDVEVYQGERMYSSRITLEYHIALVESGKIKKDEEGCYVLCAGSYYFVTDKQGKTYIEVIGYGVEQGKLKEIGNLQPYRYVAIKEFKAGHTYVDSQATGRRLLAYGNSCVSEVTGEGLLQENRNLQQLIRESEESDLEKNGGIKEEGYFIKEVEQVKGQARKERKYIDMGATLDVDDFKEYVQQFIK